MEADIGIDKIKIAKQPYLIQFSDEGKVIGELKIRKGKLHFKGKAEKSAKLLFNALKNCVDEYIEQEKGEKVEAKTR